MIVLLFFEVVEHMIYDYLTFFYHSFTFIYALKSYFIVDLLIHGSIKSVNYCLYYPGL